MGNMRRRWDTDERGTGIGSGEPFLPNIAKLGDAMRDPSWVTEDPELHLLPHLVEGLHRAWGEPVPAHLFAREGGLLHQAHAHAVARQVVRGGGSPRAGADDQDVEFVCRHRRSRLSRL